MFTKPVDSALTDLSIDLHDEFDWKVGSLRSFDFPLNVTALAIDPVASLLAVGSHWKLKVFITHNPEANFRDC